MRLQLAGEATDRATYKLPKGRMVNMYAEATSAGPAESARLPRPALVSGFTIGSPALRLYQAQNIFGGDVFAASASNLWRNGSNLGVIASGNPRMAAGLVNVAYLAVVSGGALYVYDGTSLTPITTFDDGITALPLFNDVAYLDGRWVLSVAGGNLFYWSAIGDPTMINALSFAEIQSTPTDIKAVRVLGDSLAFLCIDKTEWWSTTGDLNAPYAREQGRLFERGCAQAASTAPVIADNTLVWVGNDLVVYRAGLVPERISTNTVEEALRGASGSALGFRTIVDGHEMYVLNIAGETTYTYDFQTKLWYEFTSAGFTNFRAQCGILNHSGTAIMGDVSTGNIWNWGFGVYFDNTSDQITKICSAFAPLESGVQRCDNILLTTVRGVGNGSAPSPVVTIRWSDDGGQNFTAGRTATLGASGATSAKAILRRLGKLVSPGRIFEFECDDPVLFNVEEVQINVVRP